MSKVYEGEEWRRADDKPRITSRTRAAEQAHIDTEYCNGRMSRDNWRAQTDELSEPTKWIAKGKLP